MPAQRLAVAPLDHSEEDGLQRFHLFDNEVERRSSTQNAAALDRNGDGARQELAGQALPVAFGVEGLDEVIELLSRRRRQVGVG